MAGALLCALGLMHSYQFTPGDTTLALEPAWPWAAGYAAMSVIFALARYLTEPDERGGH